MNNSTELPQKDKRLILTDIGMCGVKAGVSCWRPMTESGFRYQVKLRSGTWDELTRDEMLDVARDLLAAAAEMEWLETLHAGGARHDGMDR